MTGLGRANQRWPCGGVFVALLWLSAFGAVGCSGDSGPYAGYLDHPPGLYGVWTSDGESFVVATQDALVQWQGADPIQIFMTGEFTSSFWGTADGLQLVGTKNGLFEHTAEGWSPVDEVQGWVRFISEVDGDPILMHLWASNPERDASWRIRRRTPDGWVTELVLTDASANTRMHRLASGDLWVSTHYTEDATDFDGQLDIPELLRRDEGEWTPVECPFLAPYRMLPNTIELPSRQEGVWAISSIWGESDGSVRVLDGLWGDVLVYDGQAWSREGSPLPGDLNLLQVTTGPDGILWGVGTDGLPNPFITDPADSAYLAVNRGAGWETTLIGVAYEVRGLAAYPGGAILTACSPSNGCDTGRILRATPDGDLTVVRELRLARR